MDHPTVSALSAFMSHTYTYTHAHMHALTHTHVHFNLDSAYDQKHAVCFSESCLFSLSKIINREHFFLKHLHPRNSKSKHTQCLVKSCFLVHRWSFPYILPWARDKCFVSALFIRIQSHSRGLSSQVLMTSQGF